MSSHLKLMLRKSWPLLLSTAILVCSCGTGRYSVVILGDTHYDTEPDLVYHSCYHEDIEWLNRVQRAEFARNGEMWRERCPMMMERAARLVSEDTKMAFQMGDLIQGDCGNPVVHEQMLEDVLNSFKSTLGGLPFITVAGNHDIRGTDALETYQEYMPMRMSEELGKEITKTTFSFNIGPDVYIFVDFNNPDVDELRKLLSKSKNARYTFIVTHGPVFPSDDSNCRWTLFGSWYDTDLRLEFRKIFAERNAICLCGHTHRIELMDWYGDGGRITQMTMNSVWSDDSLAWLNVRTTDPRDYGEFREEMKNPDGSELLDESVLFDEYRDGLKRYVYSYGAGSFKMRVTEKSVEVDFYGGDSEFPTETFVLR